MKKIQLSNNADRRLKPLLSAVRSGGMVALRTNPCTAKRFEKGGSKFATAASDYATSADVDSEAAILGECQRSHLLKKILFVGEESVDIDGALPPTYLAVDPVDGTFAKTNSCDTWAVSAGLVENGRPHLGVIWQPERDVWIVAEVGSCCLINNEIPKQWDGRALKDTFYGLDIGNLGPWYQKELYEQVVLPLNGKFRACISLCACIGSIVHILEGKTAAYINFGAKIWDIAAAAVAIEQVGGVICSIDGSPLNYTNIKQQFVAARTPEIAEHVLEIAKPYAEFMRSKGN